MGNGGGAPVIVHRLTPGLPKSSRWRGLSLRLTAGALGLALSGCASLSCQPHSITVAQKEERGRLETAPGGFTSETGRLQEVRRPEIVREYWVQDTKDTWHRVSVEQYRAAEAGQPLELCR